MPCKSLSFFPILTIKTNRIPGKTIYFPSILVKKKDTNRKEVDPSNLSVCAAVTSSCMTTNHPIKRQHNNKTVLKSIESDAVLEVIVNWPLMLTKKNLPQVKMQIEEIVQ